MIYETEFAFPGKYCEMARFLSKKNNIPNDEGINIFNSYVELLVFCAAIGIRKEKIETDPSMRKGGGDAKIFSDQLFKHSAAITYLYELAMLTYPGEVDENLSEREKLSRAFTIQNVSNPDDEVKRKKKMCDAIFTRYIFGGLVEIYNFFSMIDVHSPKKNADITKRVTEFALENVGLSLETKDRITAKCRERYS